MNDYNIPAIKVENQLCNIDYIIYLIFNKYIVKMLKLIETPARLEYNKLVSVK